ncbi:MAG: acetyl-CoA synthetase [SAR86 cluster bacterium BACL1 MAG-121105-bin34]|uniref:Acetyl-coenzyme A synthetase n=2 Tax=SAR86 cluster TaxID=62672 RepID=A0A0R2PS84_9GAMM|nr:MAG: acetyl-CoA synthetase [SAR86 cluster bacterium BACL1 MAG-120507-bin14]KRO40753.1 MAG: acetyl-CoA synthetase [SAR86 cluster bacterium BACL1 MAG-120920-bin57]KRO97285.1 MAG: acetyl-CoA synthetase [SAR86 cluster bacterium BACL1 MAG-120828-bin5]KRO99195.1 MAG: acetyl-CoA synthetase [SAR86 cluster bacterium BACL1 MAG-120823-bin87]KRP01919.1 MAG: acetyl-CoA synthetase [SAR86 cluster bacterium BACL1 MAG-120924-bin88]KRP02672.1 MAG: acetyl-CoA synthetase [SAR86 cluster bacterium BACL1 MAG-1206
MNDKTYQPPKNLINPYIADLDQYASMYQESIEDPTTFFGNAARENLSWIEPFTKVHNNNFLEAQWFEGGKLNVAYNCIDRHLDKDGGKIALIWEGDEPDQSQEISYLELHKNVCKFSNILKDLGAVKGSKICIYMPMIPEAAYAMLACARIGAIHSVVFGGFSPEALKDRILDSSCSIVVTSDEAIRGGKKIPLKNNVDAALANCPDVQHCLVIARTGITTSWVPTRDVSYQEVFSAASDICECEPMDAEDPFFILYTSGSTGKPKGVMHTTGGYLLGAHLSFKFLFGYKKEDTYWCTADVGWITGHTYILYGPLSNAATSLMFEGIPTYPNPSRFWEVCDKHHISIFYTAPTALRALMAQGDEYVMQTSRSSLRLLGTVGEPINPEAWEWYYQVVGNSACQIIDTWWQTETGSVLISPIAGVTPVKPGSATLPFFGVKPELVDEHGTILEGESSGNLVISQSWPSQIRSIYGDHQRMIETYFSTYQNKYFTGDGAKRDADGYFWITGRVDDVLNVSGHRLGTAEIESALVRHPKVAEAAIVGFDHPIKGQGIYAYVTLMVGEEESGELKVELQKFVANEISSIAKPDLIQWAPGLPKTRSGKIMRRILRKIAEGDFNNLGDISTLADPAVVESLIANKLSL